MSDVHDRYTALLLPHLDAAYNLACWLMGDAEQAQDVVQDAYARALRYFNGYRGGDPKSWLLAIVRNASYSALDARRRRDTELEEFDEMTYAADAPSFDAGITLPPTPETLALREAETQRLRDGLARLPPEYREVLVLRELEGYSYKEISRIAGIPPGTVMSRLSRARAALLRLLTAGGEDGL